MRAPGEDSEQLDKGTRTGTPLIVRRFALGCGTALVTLCVILWMQRTPETPRDVIYFYSMRHEAYTLSGAEARFHASRGRYTASLDSVLALLDSLRLAGEEVAYFGTEGIETRITHADSSTWEVVVTHRRMPTRCVYVGTGPTVPFPSTSEFARLCTDVPPQLPGR